MCLVFAMGIQTFRLNLFANITSKKDARGNRTFPFKRMPTWCKPFWRHLIHQNPWICIYIYSMCIFVPSQQTHRKRNHFAPSTTSTWLNHAVRRITSVFWLTFAYFHSWWVANINLGRGEDRLYLQGRHHHEKGNHHWNRRHTISH